MRITSTQKRQQFFTENPICCFCGGVTRSLEIDHVPGRVFFRDRQWPEGYVFPASIECNRATREEEKKVALLARLNSNDNNLDAADLEKLARDIAKYDADFMSSIQVARPVDVRQFLRRKGIAKPNGSALSDLSMIKLGPLVDQAVRKFGRKLVLALWYKHVGKILPRTGGIRISWKTNASLDFDDETLENTLAALPGLPIMSRNSQHLGDQFVYRYGFSNDNNGAAFLVWFRQSFGMLCLVAVDKTLFNSDLSNIEGPFP